MLVLRNPWRGNKDIIMVVRNTSHLKYCLKVIMYSILGFHHHPNIFLLTGYNDILSKSRILKEDLGTPLPGYLCFYWFCNYDIFHSERWQGFFFWGDQTLQRHSSCVSLLVSIPDDRLNSKTFDTPFSVKTYSPELVIW